MWTRPSSKRDSASSSTSHKRKTESSSRSSRSHRDRSPSRRSSRAGDDDRDDDVRATASSAISAPRTEYFDSSTNWPSKRRYETPEDSLKTRKKDRDESITKRKGSSRSSQGEDRRREEDSPPERRKPSSSSKDKGKTRSFDVGSDDGGDYKTSTNRRSSSARGPELTSAASAVPNQFPGQVPLEFSTSAFESSGYVGAAVDYYGDHGEYLHAVATQPGVRPHTPIVMGTEPHLMAPLTEAAPPVETGAGAAADFYAGAEFTEQSVTSPRPSQKPLRSSKPGRSGSSSALAGVAALATGAALTSQATHSSRPSSSKASTSARPSSSRPSSSKPSKYSSNGSNAEMYVLGAAGATGLTAAELRHRQHHQLLAQQRMNHAGIPSYATVSNRRQKGTLDKFVDWWNDYEDVRKMEEYSEYIGVCRYCFDPTQTVWDAPRTHRPSRRTSREFLNRKRVDKDSRYHTIEDESRQKRNSSLGLTAATATGVVGYTAFQMSQAEREEQDYDDYRAGADRRRESRGERSSRRTSDARFERRDSRRVSELSDEKQRRKRSSSHSKETAAGTLGSIAAGAAISSSGRKKNIGESSSWSSGSSSGSDTQPSGFFAKLFSPNSRKEKKSRRRRSTGLYGLSNVSVDTGLAYGGGASTLSLASKPSKRLARRRSSEIDPTKTLLALGGATAALAAAQAGSTGHKSRREIYATREPRHGIPPPPQRLHNYKRKEEEEGWESASEEDAESVDSGLAFGHTIVPSSSSDSLSSAVSGTEKWGWRWGSNKSHKLSRRRSRERTSESTKYGLNTATGATVPDRFASDDTYLAQPQKSASRRISSAPMQTIDPVPVSDIPNPAHFDPRQQKGAQAILTSPPRDLPIQHPKPVSPPKFLPYDPSGGSKLAKFGDSGSRMHRRSDSESPDFQIAPSHAISRVFTEPITSSQRNVNDADLPRRRRSNGTTDVIGAIGASVVGTAATGALFTSRRGSNKPTAETRESKNLRQDLSDNSEVERLERERRREKRRQDRASQPPAIPNAESRDSDMVHKNVETSPPAPMPSVLYDKSEATVTPSESASHVQTRHQYSVDNYEVTPETAASKATKPVFDDDVFDPAFFKKRNRAASEPTHVGDASNVFNDFTARYTEKPVSQAEFFAPTDLLNQPSPVSTREADFDMSQQRVRSNSQSSPRSAVPRLNIIAPTPPGSVSGKSSVRSASPSPLQQSTSADDEHKDDFIASRVRWGDSEINVYQVESPESFREQEYFPDTEPSVQRNAGTTNEYELTHGKNNLQDFESESTHHFEDSASGKEAEEKRTSSALSDEPQLPLSQSDLVSVFDYQVDEAADQDTSARSIEGNEWNSVAKNSKRDKKSKRKALEHKVEADRVQGAESSKKLSDYDQAREGHDQASGSTMGTFAMVGAAVAAGALVQARKDGIAQSSKSEETASPLRAMPGSFDFDEDSMDQGSFKEVQEFNEIQRDSQEREIESLEATPDEWETHSRTKKSKKSKRKSSVEEPPAVETPFEMDSNEWESTSSKKKTKKDKHRSELQDSTKSEAAQGPSPSPAENDWEVPISSKKKKKDKKSKRATKSVENLDEALPTPPEAAFQDVESQVRENEENGKGVSADGKRVTHFADLVSSISGNQEKLPGDSVQQDRTKQDHASSEPILPVQFADIVSSVSAPPASYGSGQKYHEFSTQKRYGQQTSSKPLPMASSDPEDDFGTNRRKTRKDRSSIEELDLAQVDDYAFHAPSLERRSTDGFDLDDRKAKKERKKEKKGILSFLDRKLPEAGRDTRSSKILENVARDDVSMVSESDRRVKRHSMGDFDDAVSSLVSKRGSRISRHRDDSPLRSQSSSGRRHSEDNEIGTKSRTKAQPRSAPRIDTGGVTIDPRLERTALITPLTPELVPLPASNPSSPISKDQFDQDVQSPMLPRSPSSTAIPLRFRRPPVSPIIFREAIQDSTSAPESPMTPTTSNMRRRASRPPSAEFKTNHEFRPLYLLESTRKIPEPEDNLPSLPSSRTTSRSSSVQGGSDDNFESARESPETFSASGGIAADMDIANVADDRLPDVLDSGQTTPRAGTSPRSLDHVDALDSVLNTSNSLQSATGALIAGGLVTAAHASLELHTDGTRSKLKKDESGSEGNSQDTSDPDKHTDVNADIESSEDFQATKSAFELDDLPSTKTETEEKQRQRSIGVIPEPGDDMASLVANIMNTTRTSAHSASPGETSRNSGHVDLGPQHPRLDALQIREESKELHINQEVEAKRAVESASRESFEQESAPSKDGTKSENTEDGTPLQQDPLSPSSIPEVFDPFQYMVIEDPDKGVESGNSNVTTTQSVINIPEGSRQTTTTLPSDDEPELEPSSDRRDEMVAVQREKGGPNKRTTESQLSKRGSKKESKKSSQRTSSEGTWLSSLFGSKKSKKDGKGVLADESKSLGAEQESGSEDNFWKVDDTDDTVPTAQSNVTFPLAADLVQSSQSHAISGSAEEKTEQEETRELASLPQTLAVTNASASEQDEWSIPLSAKSRKKAKKDRKSQKERTPSKVDVPRSQSSVSDTDTTKMNNTAGVKLQPQELELRNPESEDEWSTSLPKGKTKSKQDKKRTSSSSIIPNKNELVLMPSAEYAAVSKLTPEVSESIPADSEQQTDPARLDVEAEWSSVSVKTKKKAKKDKERSSVITPKAIESDHSAVLDSKHDSDKSSKSIAIEDDRVSSNLQEESNGLVVLSDKQPVKANDGPPGLSPSEDEITEREANMATDETGMDSNASTHVRQTFDVSSDFDRGEGTVSTSPQHVQKQYRSHIDMEIRNEVSDQLDLSSTSREEEREEESYQHAQAAGVNEPSTPEWITEANQDTEEVKATAAEQATTIDEPNSIAATEAKTLEQQEIKVYRAESGEGAKLRSDLSIGAAVQTTTASTLTLEQEELQESDHSRELVIAEDVQSPSITKGKSVGEGAKEVESMASDFEWSKKSKKQKRKKMADWTDGHTLQDEDNESGNKSLFADSVLAAMGAAGTVTNAENLRNDEADLLDSTTDPPGKQSKKDKKKAKVQKKQRSVDAVTVSAKPSNVIAEARNDGQDDDALTLSSHGTDRTGNEHENRIVDNGEPKKGLEFDDIVLAAMDDAGFNSKSVSVKTSQERIEEEKGVMDFGPASQTHSPLQKGRDSVPSPSSLWRLSRSPTYSPRQSPKPSRDPSDHQQEVSSAESKTKAHEDSPSSDLTTVGKVWGESEDPKRVDIHTRGGSADIETTTIPSRSTEEPSWSFAGLDHGMPNVTQHSTQDNDLQVCPGTEGVPLDSIRDSIHENDCYDPLIPDTPKVLATYATNESPAESLTTTKNRSSGLFKSPPSVRGSADVSTSLNDSSTTEEQRETPSLEDDQRQSRDFRLESKDLDTIAENEREHSPSHEHARSFSELTRSDHSVKVPERLRHLQDAKGLRAVQDVAEDEASTREALEAESLLDPISPTLDRAAARNVRQTNRMSSSTPSGTSSPGAELANNGRTYARAPGRDSGSPAEISRSKSALSNRSMTPGMIDMTDGSPSLRRVERSVGSDLRGASKRDAALAAFSNDKTEGTRGVPPASSKPPTPSYQPLKGAGKDRRQDMSEPGSNLEGWGAPSLSSPRSSPSRPPSIRKRQSTHILDLERQLDQLASENRALQETRARRLSGENFFPPSPRHEEAVKARDLEIQEKDLEIHSIKTSLETLQTEVTRLTRHNTELQNTQNDERYASLEAQHQDVHAKWQTSSRDLETLQQKHDNLSRSMETVVRGEIDDALEEKDNEIRGLRIELDQATDKIHALQQQLALTRKGEDYLNVRDEDYFDSACQQLCQHVQQWVLRYSKFSDTRACRMSHQVKDEKIETRLDNAILDGSDVDNYLSDRVRRRDVFMSVVMTMIWEFVFTRYLFGMDRDQRQKLKALEKTLTDVGPTRAVAQWRATTLTLLSRRDVFVEQRAQDTEAVVQEIYGTLSRLLPPPTHLAEQIQDSLRNVMRLAVNLSIEMRTQRAEYIMLPPLQPEYDTNGELARKVFFNASLMNERSGETSSNEELENQQAVVRLVLFPLVVKKGNDMGESDEEVVVCPAQVLIARSGKDKKVVRVMSGPTNASMYSIVPPGALDPENVRVCSGALHLRRVAPPLHKKDLARLTKGCTGTARSRFATRMLDTDQRHSLRGNTQPELSRKLYKLIKEESHAIGAYEEAGRERAAIASQLSEWGEETGDDAISDISDKLGVLLSEIAEQEDSYAQNLEESRVVLKAIRNTEKSVQPSRDHKAKIADDIAKLKYKEPTSTKIPELEQELVRSEAQSLVAEAQLTNITRQKFKESYDLHFAATIERAEKQIILAKHARRILSMLDDTPIIPGDTHQTYEKTEDARQVLNDAEDDLKAWQPSIEPIPSNAGNLSANAMPSSSTAGSLGATASVAETAPTEASYSSNTDAEARELTAAYVRTGLSLEEVNHCCGPPYCQARGFDRRGKGRPARTMGSDDAITTPNTTSVLPASHLLNNPPALCSCVRLEEMMTALHPERPPLAPEDYQLRSRSPSPDHEPSAALSPCPQLDRSFSTASSITSSSGISTYGDGVPKRRGYVRPQATIFAESARNRDSVMSLGSIAHLQYYFARTGLLDGKGAQLAKDEQLKKAREEVKTNGHSRAYSTWNVLEQQSHVDDDDPFESDGNTAYPASRVSSGVLSAGLHGGSPSASPNILHVDPTLEDPHALTLPPTVSTYKHKSTYVPPPPDLRVLRRELRDALEDSHKLLRELEADALERPPIENSPVKGTTPNQDVPAADHWHEIQGLQVLDLVTLAIRAAKNYYTSHEQPTRLYAIKPERQIRADLYSCLEVLKKLAARNFAGGVRRVERQHIKHWVDSIDELVSRDEKTENEEYERRQSWRWMDDGWEGREREREYLFLKSFEDPEAPIPQWTGPPVGEDGRQPGAFYLALQDGLKLVRLHNEMLKQSRKQFEEIKTFHTDTLKPYRCSENLRFWIKAAQLRWDVYLDVDVAGVVHGSSMAAWESFDRAVLLWCQTVRTELSKEWHEQREAMKMERPKMQIDDATTAESAAESAAACIGSDIRQQTKDTGGGFQGPGSPALVSSDWRLSSLLAPQACVHMNKSGQHSARPHGYIESTPGASSPLSRAVDATQPPLCFASLHNLLPSTATQSPNTLRDFYKSCRALSELVRPPSSDTNISFGAPLVHACCAAMPPNLHHLKSLIVDSPRHGKDKIGRVPAGQDSAPPLVSNDEAPKYSASTPSAEQHPKHRMPGRSIVALTNKNIPSTWQGSLDAEQPPPVPPKDDFYPSPATTSGHQTPVAPGGSVYRPGHLARTLSVTSVNSLSRLSFSSQINQLVSIQLPDSSSLSNSISAISTAPKVAHILDDAAAQIQVWISKATDVLEGLDAGDDAEWAAAAGRDGVGEVDAAIGRFESLIQVYIAAVEDLQTRRDVSLVPDDDQRLVVDQLDRIASDWRGIKAKLHGIKRQVELAMEWEGLRDAVFQDIGSEVEALSRQIFEMEERRHTSNLAGVPADSIAGVDIAELETIVEEAPSDPRRLLKPTSRANPTSSPTLSPAAQDDTNLLGLFARMQPLRASLDFLPMRIAGFQKRAKGIFPTACNELDSVRGSMEEHFARLESDAESLRRELGEDRWVLVFRNAGRQAQKMIDSVGRSIAKLDESLDSNTTLRHAPNTVKKVENYEAKKTHYCPAIERVLAIVERGIKDRLTVNGEILRLQHDLQSRWQTIKIDIRNMDSTLDSYDHFKTQQLRDSISSIMSSDPSFFSSVLDTPGDSSSASSIHTPDRRLSDAGSRHEALTPYANGKPRQPSSSSTSSRAPLQQLSTDRRYASSPLTLPSHSRLPQPRKTPLSRPSRGDLSVQNTRRASLSPGYMGPSTRSVSTVGASARSSPIVPSPTNRPRWTGGYTPPVTFPYDHPNPGRPAARAESSRRPSSSLANTPQVVRTGQARSSAMATPSPVISRQAPGTPVSISQSSGTSASHKLRSFRSSLMGTSGLADEEPASPSPSHNSFTGSVLSSSRSASALGKRRSMIPMPAADLSCSPTGSSFIYPRPESRQLAASGR
ncbi:hypothetical protein FH972_023140 [Carpinus fangiana]|uniref:WW domain-containing protein n=1 Tax=Carpinus fangiana TaxID=176857 RepID=A0A5N6KUK9_9ROSI|nr:hypothetical protein FH972_023140 [Carpinus fangiana]